VALDHVTAARQEVAADKMPRPHPPLIYNSETNSKRP
jgi:hypothetical protein